MQAVLYIRVTAEASGDRVGGIFFRVRHWSVRLSETSLDPSHDVGVSDSPWAETKYLLANVISGHIARGVRLYEPKAGSVRENANRLSDMADCMSGSIDDDPVYCSQDAQSRM
jgi:hypothetical protein